MESIEKVRSEMKGLGGQAIIVKTDVSQPAQLTALMEAAKAKFDRIDILVDDAGWTGTTSAVDVTEEEYDKTMDASLKSVFFACQAAAGIMLPQGKGRIVDLGSNFGVVGFKKRSMYAAAKAGVHHLSRALSLEWAHDGVVVNVVAPCVAESSRGKTFWSVLGTKVGDW